VEAFGHPPVVLAEPRAHDAVGIFCLLDSHQRTPRPEAHDVADLKLRFAQERLRD
jgi:hypothetical protein